MVRASSGGAARGRHSNTHTHEETNEDMPAEEVPLMEAVRQRCLASKSRLTVQSIEAILRQEIMSRRVPNVQPTRKVDTGRRTAFEPVVCTSPTRHHTQTNDAWGYSPSRISTDGEKKTSHRSQSTGRKSSWSPKLPQFLHMSSWRSGSKSNKVHSLETP